MCSNDTLRSCVACPRRCPEQEVTNYVNNPRIRNKFREYLHIELSRDKSLPDTICCNCVMRINCCLEFQRCIVRNMLNHRIKYYYKIGDRGNVLKYQNECKTFQAKCLETPSGVSESFFNDSSLNRLLRIKPTLTDADSIVNTDTDGLIISDVRTEELPQEPDSTGDEIESEMESELNERELLEPMFQTSENAHDTESGGNIHAQNEAISARRKYNDGTQLQCEYCNKVYRKASAWRKHIRTHLLEQRKSTTNGTTLMASGNNGTIGSNSVNSETITNVEKRKYKCTKCSQQFDTMHVLRKHGIAHEQRFNCDLCDASFRLEHDYTWHRICCDAKNSISDSMVHSLRRRTRSQGQPRNNATSSGKNEIDNRSESSRYSVNSTQSDSMYNEKIEVVKSWTRQLDIGDKPDPNNFHDDDCLSVLSDVSGMTRLSEVASTSIRSMAEVSSKLSRSSYSDSMTSEQKRRKVHKAGKRRARQTGKAYYACSFRHKCTFGSTSLKKTMAHEVKEHKSLLLHNCVECNLWFTTKENLIRHKKSHRPYLHICINCDYKFDNKYELEHHILSHAEKSYYCQFCYMSFLKRTELEEHTQVKHKTNTTQKKIIFERFTVHEKNNTGLRKTYKFNGYQSKELIQPRISNTTPNMNNTAIATRAKQANWDSVDASNSTKEQANIQNSAAFSANTGKYDNNGRIKVKAKPKRFREKDPKLLTLPMVVVQKYLPE